VSFHVLPGVQLEVWRATTVLGMTASQKLGGGVRWTHTAVICTQCGRTESFTTNAAELAQHVPGSHIVTGVPR
jgi:hypothetical protein